MNKGLLIRCYIACFILFIMTMLIGSFELNTNIFMILTFGVVLLVFLLPIRQLDRYNRHTLSYWTFVFKMTAGAILIAAVCFIAMVLIDTLIN